MALVERELKIQFRSKAMALLMLSQPLLITFLFVLSMSGVVGYVSYRGLSISYLHFMAPSIVILTIMFPAMMISQSVFNEKFSNMLLILLSTSLKSYQYILGKLLSTSLISMAQGIIMLGAYNILLGVIDANSVLYMLPSVLAASLAFSGMYLTIMGIVRTISGFASTVNILTLVLMYSAPLFYPLEAMPYPLNIIALVNPVTYLVEGMRLSLISEPLNIYILVSYATAVSLIMASVYAMRRLVREG